MSQAARFSNEWYAGTRVSLKHFWDSPMIRLRCNFSRACNAIFAPNVGRATNNHLSLSIFPVKHDTRANVGHAICKRCPDVLIHPRKILGRRNSDVTSRAAVPLEWKDVIDTYKSPRCWREEDEAGDRSCASVPRRDDRRTVVWRHLPCTDARWSWYRIHGPLPQDSCLYPASTPALFLVKKKRKEKRGKIEKKKKRL